MQTFLDEHKLPNSYKKLTREHFRPIAERIARNRQALDHPLVVGINGCQGSGKSTLAQTLAWLLEHEQHVSSCVVSLDDFYLTQAERQQLDLDVHPLLAQRGVPGTHDTKMATQLLKRLKAGQCPVDIPRFSKADDERSPTDLWQHISTPPDIIIIEGWCLGVTAQNFLELIEPVNELERHEDKDGIWRHYVNTQLQQHYQPLFALIDTMIMLQAPSFKCVYQWRLEQEEKLRARLKASKEPQQAAYMGLMDAQKIAHFIQQFQRLTQHALQSMPSEVEHLLVLDEKRNIEKVISRS
jgi:D-glycerate 3-kinase